MDLRTFKRRIGSPVAGIVSGREFGGYVRLDFGAGAIDFSKPASGLAASDPGVVPFELTEAGMPVVSATLDGRHVQPAGIDTMASATVSAPEPMLRQLELVTDSTRRLEVDLPPTGEAHPGGAQVRLKSVRVGGGEVREPICALGGEGGMARLGMGFLRRFRVTLDYETKLLRLEPLGSGEPMREGPLVGYGIGLWRFDGSHWSVWVARGSSAARGGLVSGGILTAIDGKDLKGMGYDGARALLEPHEGTKVSVSVLQGDETHTVELVAEELL
jgi:hypothetical protein